MRKYIITIVLFGCFSIHYSGLCQNWQALGNGINGLRSMFTDTTTNILYIGSSYNPLLPISGFIGWTGTGWDTTINKNPWGNSNGTLCINKYNGEIYIGTDKLKKWDGSDWITIQTGSPAVICNLSVINNELYVGGGFDSIGGIAANNIAKWDGITWTALNMPVSSQQGVYAICEYKGEIYFGGNFYNYPPSTDTLGDIIRYDGNNWKSVGGGLHGGMSEVVSMVVYKNELYVAGTFTKSGGNVGNYIQKWDGTQWSEVGGGVMGINGSNGQIWDIMVYNDKLYAAGYFTSAGEVPAQYIAAWDSTKWCGLGSIFNSSVKYLEVLNGMLYIGGAFSNIDGYPMYHIAKWTGGNYVDTCGNTSSINEVINKENDITVFPNPSNGAFQIANSKEQILKVEIYNMLGKEVYSAIPKTTAGTNDADIDLSGMPAGVYMLKVHAGKGVYVGKVVKE